MGFLNVTGSYRITASGRDVTTSYGALWPSFQYLATLGNTVVPKTAYVPFTQPPDAGTPIYPISPVPLPTGGYEVLLGEGSNDDHSWGLKAAVGARGIVSATSAAILNYGGVSADAMPNWEVGFSPLPGNDLLPTWSSYFNTVSTAVPGNFYTQPIFTVSTVDVGDITSPTFSYGGSVPGNHIILLTGQGGGVVHPLSSRDQNGLWVFTTTLGITTATRPSDWSAWVSNWSDESGAPNSVVLQYGYVSGSTAPFTVTNDGPAPPSGSMWLLTTPDGLTWAQFSYGANYHNGNQVLANDSTSYQWSASYSGVLGPNPVDSAVVTPAGGWSWVSTGYQSSTTRNVDIGQIGVSYTAKLAVVLLSPVVSAVTSISLYACAGTDNQGAFVGTFTPQAPTHLGVTLLPPTAGFQQFDYFMGSGTQEWYDGNPVSFQFTLPSNNFRLIFGSATSSVLAPTSNAATLTAALTDVISRDTLFGGGTGAVIAHGLGTFYGYVMGAAGRNLGAIGCQGISCQTWDQVTGIRTNFPLNGTSSAWYGNIYIVAKTPTLQTAAQVAAAFTAGGNTATATEAGPNAFQVVLRSSTDPNPKLVGRTPRQPWRVVVNFADGTTGDSYSPGPICTVTGRGLAHETNALVSGNLTTPPPSTGEYGFWVTVAITGNIGPVNPSVPASGSSIANDVYHRPVIAIDTGSGTAIAVTYDAGASWTTHAGPGGSLPSLVIDGRSNTFTLAVNSGTTVTVRRNPNADWASTTGMTTVSTISGAAGAIYGEPNNWQHMFAAVVVSGALKLYESFDGGGVWTLRSTVVASGMATNRGLCASIQWVAGALFIIYSEGTDLWVQRSVDGGTTWAAAVSIASGHTYSWATAVVQGGQVIVRAVDDTGSSTPWHHWQSSDLAATWTDVTNASTPQTKATQPSAIGKWEQSGKLIISGSNLT